MRTEEKLRQAERNGDIQTQVRIHLRVLNHEAAKYTLFKANVVDIWALPQSRLTNSRGHKTSYKCPHCHIASEYQIGKILLQCPSCDNYYLDSSWRRS